MPDEMQQQAAAFAADLSASVKTVRRLRDLGRADDAADELECELMERPAGVSEHIVLDVEIYGGGPAGGVRFECESCRHGLTMLSARTWHQDWFQAKSWAVLDEDVAEYLFSIWGLETWGPT